MPRHLTAAAASEPSSPATSWSTTTDASPADPALAASPGGHRSFVMRINLASCKYPVLRVVQRQLGWLEVDDEDAHVHWCDTSASTERLVRLARPQKLNHFPGMLEIARKKALARNLAAMRALYPEDYDFSPRSFLLPEMMEAFEAELAQAGQGGGGSGATRGRRPTFILKLDNGSMGRGIKLVQTYSQALAALPTFEHENVVASRYIDRPLLIDGKKFDLRIYVLVRCCNPLRIFLCREGLVRFCTERYEPPAPGNLGNTYAHLTNYAVNKSNPAFVFNEDAQQGGTGSKWTISAFAQWMRGQGHDFDALWAQVAQIVCKTLIAAQPMLQYQYDCSTKADDDGLMCFELLGYDVLIDEDLRPWLLEVNHSPSLTTDTPLDLELKSRLVREVLALAGVQPQRVRAELAAKERAKQARLYSSHAACVAHAAAAAAAAIQASSSSPGKGVKPVCPEEGEPSSCPPSPGPEPAGALPAGAAAAAAGPSASGDQPGAASPGPCGAASPGPRSTAASPGAGSALLGPAAGEPARSSPEWDAAQRAYEDAHLGQFDRIMPPDDPEQAALYERLLGGALQVFYRSTMQGRNQHRLLQIRERRLQEEAEAAAKQEALQRRAEGLRAWMAAVCQRHREERQLRAAAAAAEGALAGTSADPGAADGMDADGGSGGSMDGGGSDGNGAGSRGGAAAAADAEAAALLQSHFTVARLYLPSYGRQQHQPQRAAHHSDSSGSGGGRRPSRSLAVPSSKLEAQRGVAGPWLSVSGKPVGAPAGHSQHAIDSARESSTSGHPDAAAAQPPRRPRSAVAGLSQTQSATLEDVVEQRLAAVAAAGGEAAAAQPTELLRRPGSAALVAWAEVLTKQQGQQQGSGDAVLHPQQVHPWQQQRWEAYGRPAAAARGGATGSSTFLERVADFTQRQQAGAEPEPAALHLHSASDASGASFEHSGSDQDTTACSADGSVLSAGGGRGGRGAATPTPGACGMGGLPAPPPLGATYIPPTLLSALHGVRMSPRLLSGLRGRAGAAAAAGASAPPLPHAQAQQRQQQQQQGRAPWPGAGSRKRDFHASGDASKANACSGGAGHAALDLPWALASLQQAGGASPPPCGQLPACKGSPSGALAGLAAQHSTVCPPAARRGTRAAPTGRPGQQGSGMASPLAAPAKAGAAGLWSGSQQYRASIEEQAVQSVASLISDMINARGL